MAGDRLKSNFILRGAKATGSFVTGSGDLRRSYDYHKDVITRVWTPLGESLNYLLKKKKRKYTSFQEVVEMFDLTDEDIDNQVVLRKKYSLYFKLGALFCLLATAYHGFFSTSISTAVIFLLLFVLALVRSLEMDWRAEQYSRRELISFVSWLKSGKD